MAAYRCIGNNKIRIVTASTDEEARAKCMEVYGYSPDSVDVIVARPEDR